MKERPILFSAPMVRALLDGSKTQTRRVVKFPHQNPLGTWEPGTVGGGTTVNTDGTPASERSCIWHTRTGDTLVCPHGQPGDRLWVRETFAEGVHQLCDADHWVYAADPFGHQQRLGDKWKPSIFMPRWASRITLDITGVRVERLQDISEVDALAEGIDQDTCVPVGTYRDLWESINGHGSWDANPWVWVVKFKNLIENATS